MMRISLRRPSAALVIATGAMFVALAGTGYALSIPKNSVGTKQLKANAVTSAKIKNGQVAAADLATNAVTATKIGANAVTGAKIADGSILFGDARLGEFVQGPASIVTLSGDPASGLEGALGTVDGFGDVTYGCATNSGTDQLTVNNASTGMLTLTVFSAGAVVGTPVTAPPTVDAEVDLGPNDAYTVQLETGTSIATLSLTRVLSTNCHVVMQGVSNVS